MNSLALPPLYRPWIDEILGQPVLSEPRATCESCVMCSNHERPAEADYYFNPNTKCCAYHPSLPNYLIGAVLSEVDPEFVESKEHFVRGAFTAEITPIGINPPYWTEMFYKLKPFGKHEQILCPFYIQSLGGACAIWKYRNGRCSTWFCKHERGTVGWRFWRKLDQLLNLAEVALSRKCIALLEVVIPENPVDVREKFWGNWMFREHEFFQKCWEIVLPLKWQEVLEIGGDELKSVTVELEIAFHQIGETSVPEALQIAEFTQEDVGEGFVRIWAYSKYNPLDLRKEVADVLHYFDGRPVGEVLNEIETESSVRIDEKLLIQLTDYEILVVPEAKPD